MLAARSPQEDIAPDPSRMMRLARVISVDHAAGTARVAVGDPDSDDGEVESADVPWLATRCGENLRTWTPPSPGEQVHIFCPEGELGAAIIMGSLSSDAHPNPGNSKRTLIQFGDEGLFAYDPEAHHADILLPAGATLTLTADGGIAITGDVTIDGNVSVTGTVDATEDVTADGISLKTHTHSGVQAGAANTGAPQ